MQLILYTTALFTFLPGGGAAAATTAISGKTTLDDGFTLAWTITPPHIDFHLDWNASDGADWAAIGLHDKPGSGMPDAEIFLCCPSAGGHQSNAQAFCDVRNSAAGYELPALDKTQYLTLLSSSRAADGSASASFRRTLAAVPGSPLSVAIATDQAMGLIYARGAWNGKPMPAGQPDKHTSCAGRTQVNFYSPGPSPSPAPTPGPAGKKAGVWPSVFEANMTIARDQIIDGGRLSVSFWAEIHYDFPRRRQLWQYYSLDPSVPGGAGRQSFGGELWVNESLYELSPGNAKCSMTNLGFDIIRPDWLQGTHYLTTNFLLRQPEPGQHWSNYTRSDLYTLPNTIGLTNSWVVEDSKIAQPVRLEGPDDFDQPSWRSILEYGAFRAVDGDLPDKMFEIPAACKKNSSSSSSSSDVAGWEVGGTNKFRRVDGVLHPKYRGSGLFVGVQRALLMMAEME